MTPPLQVTVVEDHDALRELTVSTLQRPEFLVAGYRSAEDLLGALPDNPPDIAILDVNLPGIDGYSLARQLRAGLPAIGILMLTVRDDSRDKITGYDSGADIYLPKPVCADELLAAVGALARRQQNRAKPETLASQATSPAAASTWRLSDDGWTYYDKARRALPLTAQERLLISALATDIGNAFTRDALVIALGEDPSSYDLHRLEVLVSRLRRKAAEYNVDLPLRAIRGIGYVMPA